MLNHVNIYYHTLLHKISAKTELTILFKAILAKQIYLFAFFISDLKNNQK